MTTKQLYDITPDSDGWRQLPNGNYVKLGNCVTLGDGVKLGNYVKLGKGVTLGDYVNLGDYVVRACSIHNAYSYTCTPQIKANGDQWVQMGCYLRSRADWDKDFWNNPGEFPNDGSVKSQARLTAYRMACLWLDANSKKE